MDIAIVGIDLGKNSCSLAALDGTGAVVLRRRLSRAVLVAFVGRLPSCVVAMEACCGAHHLGRVFEAQGAQGATDGAGVCPALREGPEER